MSKFGSPEWLARYQELGATLPGAAGVTARVQHVVPGSPDGEVRYLVSIVDGRLTEVVPGIAEDADVGLTTKYPDAMAILNGRFDANAAFISGRTKVTGRTGTLLGVLALYGSEPYEALRTDLAAATEV